MTSKTISPDKQLEYYQALVNKDADYEGVFFAGITTTGIFCRPTCPARKPKYENCEFYETAQAALLASFRPCKRCRPLSLPGEASELISKLVSAVEDNPEKRWTDADFRELSVDASTVRRQFKKRFGMTFVAYARARRMGIAMQEIRQGSTVIQAQLATGYESGSGFRDAFSRIMGAAPTESAQRQLKTTWIDTLLGPMLAIADESALYLLEFVDRRGLEREIEKLRQKTKAALIPGSTQILKSIEEELAAYFSGRLQHFKTPVATLGTPFQQQVWDSLRQIPYGETRAYADLANELNRPKGYRAVARANGTNQLAIIIPCHRVIQSNGELAGYAGGVARKKWLLEHEVKSSQDLRKKQESLENSDC